MKIYKIKTGFGDRQNHCVVADNIGQAERIFKAKYSPITIISIELISEYVQIQNFDEQSNEAR